MTDEDPFSDGGQLLREMEADPNPPKCDTCGVALFRHLGLTGTCRQKMEAEAKLNKIFALVDAYEAPSLHVFQPSEDDLIEDILALREPRKEGINQGATSKRTGDGPPEAGAPEARHRKAPPPNG